MVVMISPHNDYASNTEQLAIDYVAIASAVVCLFVLRSPLLTMFTTCSCCLGYVRLLNRLSTTKPIYYNKTDLSHAESALLSPSLQLQTQSLLL